LSKHHDDDKSYPKSREVLKEGEEAKRRIVKENPDISKDELSLPIERKVLKVIEPESIHATAEQQEEMERLLLKKNNKG
jgi:hypothetical protein